MIRFARRLSLKASITVSPEVTQALNEKVPIVLLESTIITHGFPFPANIDMARAVEQKIRDNGCIPATCAFIKGEPIVGLSDTQLQYLAEQKDVNKVSRRDIGVTMSQKMNGGTTIAGTMILSHLSGIKVFATGGLGGVHRDGHITMDVSADLTELSRTPVSVVCAGPKLILDVPRTMEYLETQGVFVSTYNDNKRSHVEIPGFFCRNSGVSSPYSFSSWHEIAEAIHNLNNVMGLDSGNLICIPPPEKYAFNDDFMSSVIDKAEYEATKRGISGKALTPFLLQRIAKDTEGKSVKCNKEFVMQNAEAACNIATELVKLENDQRGTFQPSTVLKRARQVSIHQELDNPNEECLGKKKTFRDEVDTIVIGLFAMDTIGKMLRKAAMGDSNPGGLKTLPGGVGYNVKRSHQRGTQSQNLSNASRLISAVGNDISGKVLLSKLNAMDEDVSGISILEGKNTAQYSAIIDENGELIVAVADMEIIEDLSWRNHITKQIERAQPRNIIIDCNLLSEMLSHTLIEAKKLSLTPKVIVEPTSQIKLKRLSKIDKENLKVFPNNIILMITPTVNELESIFTSFTEQGLLEDFDEWFPVLDALGINSDFREKLNVLASKSSATSSLLKNGSLQQAFQILPYVPHIMLKLGAQGCVLIRLSTDVTSYKSVPTTSPYKPAYTITSSGQSAEEGKRLGVVVQHFPIPKENESLSVADVTGAGDTLLGYLSSCLLQNDWLESEITSLEQEWWLWESIYKAQLESGRILSAGRGNEDDL